MTRPPFALPQAITAVGNSKGHHVRFRDAVRGPFSPDELLLIRRAIVDGKGTDFDRATVMLHLELGHNALATIRLKNRDLLRFETSTGVFYQLDVPRAKKRTAQRETKRRPISNKLGDFSRDSDEAARMIRYFTGFRPQAPRQTHGQP